ncbi:MAG: extracellular solute-binding protein [Spirochaetia bacterium]|jgi:spermidine/putrescine transport system substrate-binding protein|nr:extracellular solute-binding protein [Spirochaetia bacterium]
MKKRDLLSIFAVVLTSCLLVSCSSKKKTLYLFNWTCYTPQSVIEEFENTYDVNVEVDNFASNEEMFAKLLCGATGYDVIFPSQDYVSILIKLGMLEKIDLSKIPNVKYLSALVKEKATYDPGFVYSVPYFMGAAGVSVNKEKVHGYDHSWDIFSRTDLAGHMSMMDDMREVLGDALAYKGYSVNTLDDGQLAQAEYVVNKVWKPNLAKFDSEGFGKSFASGDFYVVQGYPEIVFGELKESDWDKVDYFVPKEGGPMYIDSMCIPKGAKDPELAMLFMNFIHRPDVYAQFLDEFRFPPSVNEAAAAYMTTVPMYATSQLASCQIKDDVGAGLEKYNDIWQKIRFSGK